MSYEMSLHIDAANHHRNYVHAALHDAKRKIEEFSPLAIISISEKVDMWGNKYVVVLRNVAPSLLENVLDWMNRFEFSLVSVR
jgi:hypothetical protein